MKLLITLFFALLTFSAFSEINIKIYHEQNQDGFTIYADNEEYCPVSVKINFSLRNLKTADGDNNIYVIPARSKKTRLTDLSIVKNARNINLSYQYSGNYGDATKTDFDEDYQYFLPFKKGTTHNVWQGYKGRLSHHNENALDFTMPVGTELFAIREGIVIKVVDKNKRHCTRPECAQYNNYILVYHPDGTMADYAHIKQNGAEVKIGDEIEKGQFIGYSGNVGYTSGPHLHLSVFLPKLEKQNTLETKFLTGDGSQAEYLKEKQDYHRNY